jgi:integrase
MIDTDHDQRITLVNAFRDGTRGSPEKAQEDHTSGHRNCPACELTRRAMIEPSELAHFTFMEAAKIWIVSHGRHIGAGTLRDYWNCLRALDKFFGQLRLNEIHIGHFEQYQKMRSDGSEGLTKVGASRVNHDLNTLAQILARAGLWAPIAPHYKPLRMTRSNVGRALSESEEHTLFQIASSRAKWKVAYFCSLLSINTTCGPQEIRLLRLTDVDLSPTEAAPHGTIRISLGAKNAYRDRMIPLNTIASLAIRQLWNRAHELGSVEPDHYLLPHRASRGSKGWDPTRPTSSWRKAWDKLRIEAGLPHLRLYDLRHHAITRLLEDETVSERTVIDLAGHVSRQMLARYSHIRLATMYKALCTMEKKQPCGEPNFQEISGRESKKLKVVGGGKEA